MNKAGKAWSNDEIEVIVADYLEMLGTELAGGKFNKAERNRALQRKIGRSKGSIEYKHQNVSAVMERLGLPRILGYKPAKNFQGMLYEIVDDQLLNGELAEKLANQTNDANVPEQGLFYQDPPQKQPEQEPIDRVARRIIRFFDPATRDARARKLGEAGERFLYVAEQNRLSSAGRDDLAGKVRWVSKEDGDGAGYDILSYTRNGDRRLLEVKTTNGPATTPFWISRNELDVSEENSDVYRIARLYQFSRMPEAYKLKPPLADHLHLRAAEYFATFR